MFSRAGPNAFRFVSLMPRLFTPLMILLRSLSGERTGPYFADSTKLAVSPNRRVHRHTLCLTKEGQLLIAVQAGQE